MRPNFHALHFDGRGSAYGTVDTFASAEPRNNAARPGLYPVNSSEHAPNPT